MTTLSREDVQMICDICRTWGEAYRAADLIQRNLTPLQAWRELDRDNRLSQRNAVRAYFPKGAQFGGPRKPRVTEENRP